MDGEAVTPAPIGVATAGEVFGRYFLEAEIGQGGVGCVFRARHLYMDRVVAIKVLHPDLANDPTARGRFLREARLTGRLHHPSVVSLFDFGEVNGQFFLVMELLEGESIRRLIDNRGPFPASSALRVLEEVLSALQVAHAAGVVHRDLKANNVMITTDGRVKVLDFGIARLLEGGVAPARELTATNEFVGTPGYAAPEQIRKLPLDHRVDLYQVGVLLFEMLSGRTPFGLQRPSHLFERILRETPAPVSQMAPRLKGKGFDEVVARALAKEPEDRYPDAEAMRAALQELRARGAAYAAQETLPGIRLGVKRPSGEMAQADQAIPPSPVSGADDPAQPTAPPAPMPKTPPPSAPSPPPGPPLMPIGALETYGGVVANREPDGPSPSGPVADLAPPGNEWVPPATPVDPAVEAPSGGEGGPGTASDTRLLITGQMGPARKLFVFAGSHLAIGRSARDERRQLESDVLLRRLPARSPELDPENWAASLRISKVHGAFNLASTRTLYTDSSRSGSLLDGEPVGPEPCRLPEVFSLELGGGALQLSGRILFHPQSLRQVALILGRPHNTPEHLYLLLRGEVSLQVLLLGGQPPPERYHQHAGPVLRAREGKLEVAMDSGVESIQVDGRPLEPGRAVQLVPGSSLWVRGHVLHVDPITPLAFFEP